MKERYLAAIDQGTASSRCLVFDRSGRIVAVAQKEHRQLFPRPGWVEHDPLEIWANVEEVVRRCLAQARLEPSDLVAIGIANQRETTLVWERESGRPVYNAINWQDTRTDQFVRALAADVGQEAFRERSGLPAANYFSGPKIRWLLDAVPGLRRRAQRGEELLEVLGVPRAMLPEIRPSAEVYGEARGQLAGIPVSAALGDQQAALFGQTCFDSGEAKCTYGTGSFLLMNTGAQPVLSSAGLLTTPCCQIAGQPPSFALEGSIAVTGALVQWFRDNLNLISSAPEIETLARTVEDNGGCYFVPAFSGLFAPHWRSDARGVIAGLTSYITKGHLARAVLEATAWQTREVLDAMVSDAGISLGELRVDGGMTANNLLMQFLADVLDVVVVRPIVAETVSLGAAYAAGLAIGFWPDTDALRSNWHIAARWRPAMEPERRERGYRKWRKAVARAIDWVDEDDREEDGR